ncbi:hypothetical protein RUND412_007767 [Rhizina undulata]
MPIPGPSRLPRNSLSSPPAQRPTSSSSPQSKIPPPSPTTPRPDSSNSKPLNGTLTPSRIPSSSFAPRPSSRRSDVSEALRSANEDEKVDHQSIRTKQDALRMPPPPAPSMVKSVSNRSRSTTNASVDSRTSSSDAPLDKNVPSTTTRSGIASLKGNPKPKSESKLTSPTKSLSSITAAAKSLGRTMSLRSSASKNARSAAAAAADNNPRSLSRSSSSRSLATKSVAEKKEPVKKESSGMGSLLGRTMSLRSSSKSSAAAAAAGRNRESALVVAGRKDAASGGVSALPARTLRPRPMSMHEAPPTARSESVSSTSSIAPKRPTPPPGHRAHKRTGSNSTITGIIAALPSTTTNNNNTKNPHTSIPSTNTTTTSNIANPKPPSLALPPQPPAKQKRPAFSTLTQDFTPKPEIPLPAPPSQPSLDPAIVFKQTQLLQLLLLHSSSSSVFKQLISSASTALRTRFDSLALRHAEAREALLKQQKTRDLDALSKVVNAVSSGINSKRRETLRTPEERVHGFSEALKKIDTLQAGEFRKLTTAFGDWIAGYGPASSLGADREKWIDGLGALWRNECVGVSRRLEVAIRGIEGVASLFTFAPADDDEDLMVSTVQRVSEGYLELAKGMGEEMEMMRRMEEEVVVREREGLKRRVEGVLELGAGVGGVCRFGGLAEVGKEVGVWGVM